MTTYPFTLNDQDVDNFTQEIMALRRAANERMGLEDFKHLQKIERWGRLSTLAGYGTAWLAPNPVSAFLISQGNVTRWTTIAHHVLHKGFDKIEGIPTRYTSQGFAKGWRRFLDWNDWLLPDAWSNEHNKLHHYNLGEAQDPDQVELNLDWLRHSNLPMPVRYAIVGLFAATWKPLYYAPNTLKHLRSNKNNVLGQERDSATLTQLALWNPLNPAARDLWSQCLLPYIFVKFVLIPLLFIPLGPIAVINVWINTLLAEIISNLHAFLVIVPNHVGDDILLFEEAATNKSEFFLRQITGSANFKTGGDFNDFLHGWLNYQIEHHLWPDLPMSEYQRLQPQVKALCEKYGIPYVQESVWKRLKKTVDVMVGNSSMPRQTSVSRNVRKTTADAQVLAATSL
ncbi:fatty acid desaturase family protein [Agitococcus lubricus]|uniref:Fatty acid desaturase n=1 Tax=Agitococcus lubricus TaxID=1077255 RepID=A0A2T5ITL5_9GAMM|nr:fatty acid desaturase [Agitococcus lubricus]PTQ87227.1 fatty acid desaturase [Agitococcus lubricus]